MDSIDKLIRDRTGQRVRRGRWGYIRICYASKYEQLCEALTRLEKVFGKKQG